ncbi:homocysteine S-methyltransferase [Arcobacter sp. CECT 8985]|uniref:homocysteine S-methyltransferase n=1 Tax=Arcobacter sp. CECT 8985 TaxID=1935424 RepID=UPI00100ABD61|nr:homocysteine S-methyltransferase [Arcobacter sp. CECT 8985]RXJ88023.1 homocysteine S-methyltransferase [Arcobacter sp. CECT 8985]
MIIDEILKTQKAVILDGALGTQIQKNGYDVNDKLWSAKYLDENIEVISQVHRQYLEAGADCIITSSYQASIEGFIQKGFTSQRAKELIKKSIEIAKETVDEFWQNTQNKNTRIKPIVAASIGPYGAYLADGSEYSGDYKISKESLKEFHKKRLEIIIIKTNPDILAIETIPSFYEASVICDLLEELDCKIPAWVTFSAKDGFKTNANDDIKKCMSYLQNHKFIHALGVNCTAPQYILKLIKNIKEVSTKPIVIYPNGGSRYNPITKEWEKGELSSKEFSKLAYLWYEKGARVIGGCCETTPDEISEIRKVII